MHEVWDVEIAAILWAIALVVVVSVLILNHTKAAAARKVEILKLQRLAAEEVARAEQEEEEFLSKLSRTSSSVVQNHSSSPLIISHPPPVTSAAIGPVSSADSSPVVKQVSFSGSSCTSTGLGVCAVCSTPTKKRCSRCKVVQYCSQQCQVEAWRDGHKQNCQSNAESSSEKVGFPIAKDDDSNKNGTLAEERLPAAPLKPSRTLETVTTDGSLPKPSKILFPYEYFIELFTWNKLNLIPCGLINCGNSCFANVVLQCLTYTRPLAAYLLEGRHSEECRRNEWCFMCELQNHVSRVWESQIPFSPVRIVSQIGNIGNHMGYGRQEDAHEYMRFAIDSMQSICLDKVGGEKAVDQRTRETTFIQHIFGGHLQSQVRCMQCHHESHRYENMMDLAVEIQGNVETLEDALAQFTAPEWLDGDNKYKCDRCNAYVKAWKRLVVHEAPNILTIALKRFQSGKFGKLNKRVTFPDILDMSPYMSDEGDKPPHYQLYGVIVHIDMLNASFFGHYICYVKDLHGFWYKVDDSTVKEVDLDKVMQQRAYMLLYTRSAPRHAPIIEGGMQQSEHIDVNSCNSRRTAISNGNHILSEPSIFLSEVANGNGSNLYMPESNGIMLFSEYSDILTQ